MATNQFKPFATRPDANVTPQSEWENLPALLSGFAGGKASSAQVNKALRQTSFIAAALAQFVSDKSGQDVLDDGDITAFLAKLTAGFGKQYLSRQNPFADIKADGAGAVSAALANLGLGTAAKRDVGNSTNQIPDMSFFTLALSGAFRLPTGHIIQTGGGTTVSGGFTQAYPYPFPGSCQALVGIVYGNLGQRAFVTSNSSDRTAANLNIVDINGNGLNASVGYIAIGY